MTVRKINLFISSSEELGAVSKSADGSRFEVHFNNPIQIPEKAKNVVLRCLSANLWWSVPNIKEGNNKIYFTHNATDYTLTLQKGLYDVDALNDEIKRLVATTGTGVDIKITGNDATGKITLEIIPPLITDTLSVDFSQLDTFNSLLGFNAQVYNAGIHIAESVAEFSAVSSFLIHTDLVRQGLSVNGKNSQVLANVNIDVEIGALINYRPYHPSEIYNDMLIGRRITNARFYITDQQNRVVDTNGENYDFVLEIKWTM